jgi:hypothetical protein
MFVHKTFLALAVCASAVEIKLYNRIASTKVFNQGQLGTCYLHAAIDAIIGLLAGPKFDDENPSLHDSMRAVLLLHLRSVFGDDGGWTVDVAKYVKGELLQLSEIGESTKNIIKSLNHRRFTFNNNTADPIMGKYNQDQNKNVAQSAMTHVRGLLKEDFLFAATGSVRGSGTSHAMVVHDIDVDTSSIKFKNSHGSTGNKGYVECDLTQRELSADYGSGRSFLHELMVISIDQNVGQERYQTGQTLLKQWSFDIVTEWNLLAKKSQEVVWIHGPDGAGIHQYNHPERCNDGIFPAQVNLIESATDNVISPKAGTFTFETNSQSWKPIQNLETGRGVSQ